MMLHPVMANCLSIKLAFVARAISALSKPQMIPKHVPNHSTHCPRAQIYKILCYRLIRIQVLKPLKDQCGDPVSNKGLTLGVNSP